MVLHRILQHNTSFQLVLSNNKNFLACTSTDSNFIYWKDLGSDGNSLLSLKPSPNLELLVNHFNSATPENSNDHKNIFLSKYCEIVKMHNIKISHKKKLLTSFHINAFSLLNLNNCVLEFTPNELSANGTLLYIANHLSCKCCNDVNIYKKNEMESNFIEIVTPPKNKKKINVLM